jgi:hypothetical protein
LNAARLIPDKSAQLQARGQAMDERTKTYALNRSLNHYCTAFHRACFLDGRNRELANKSFPPG